MTRQKINKNPQYFEAIFQLRDGTEDLEKFAFNEIRKPGIHLAKVKKVTNGHDFYFGDKDFARKLGKKIQQQFGGTCLITATLYGKKEDREVYRLTVLYRGLHFKKGDSVIYRGKEYTIRTIGKEIFLQSPANGKKTHIKQKDFCLLRKK